MDFDKALKDVQRTGFTNGEKLGNWSYNGAPVVAIQRTEGWVVITKDGLPAATPAVKGRSWLKNAGIVSEASANLFLDDSSIANPAPTAQELATYAAIGGGTLPIGASSTTTPINLGTGIVPNTGYGTGTGSGSDTVWYKTTGGIVGLVAGAIALLGLAWYALKGGKKR